MMRSRTQVLVLLVVVVLVCAAAVLPLSRAAPASASECLDLGFDADTVRCSACEKLFLMTQSSELRRECEGCCVADDDSDVAEDQVTYTSARIEGRGIVRAMAATEVNVLAVFKRAHASEPYFQHISFVDRFSATHPQVVLVGSDSKDAVTMPITGWSADTLHNFFKKKIHVA
ncbi:hypothetical protein NESM_000242900 [Novymonas esmeraldas]|uniref:Selenoprotein F/M domain-containing protein n=1 Tax=Novymonas esmeraldas TaxID=1808958 RepID=A0AAW0FB39_9TRYP